MMRNLKMRFTKKDKYPQQVDTWLILGTNLSFQTLDNVRNF